MRSKRFAFALFAAAVLFSMLREWGAPRFCARTSFPLASSAQSRP